MKSPGNNYYVIILITCIIFASSIHGKGRFLGETDKPSPLKNSDQQSAGYKLQKSIHNIYELYKDSIVFISTEKTVKMRKQNPFMFDPFFKDFFNSKRPRNRTRKLKGLGTGFIISSDGYICTNHHVVAQADNLTVKINDKEYKAKVIGSDQLTDIALLKINAKKKLKPVHFGNSDSVKIGNFVVAIGNPFGLDKTYTFGIVSATGRRHIDQLGNSHIQTDASINRGNSGGPLINIDGEVIGVNRIIYSRTGGSIGIGFAISINTARKTLIQLKKFKKVKRGFIGVQISDIQPGNAKKLGLKKRTGVLVRALVKNGPALKAGIKVNDIITKIDGKEIANYRGLIKIISDIEIGKSVKASVLRNRKIINISVKVTERP